MNNLANKVAIVTASTRGIGLAIVKEFAAEGATVYMAGRSPEAGAVTAAEINAAVSGKVKVVYCDAMDHATYEPMVDEVLKNEGRIDILVNNFGGSSRAKDLDIMNCKYEDYIGEVEKNLASVFIPSQLVINKAMIPQRSGSIINIGSVAGLIADTTQCAYGTAKAGILHLTKMIATHAARYNIRCNIVCPGMTGTDAVANNLTPEYKAFFFKHTPLKRMATAEEISAAVTYFASDAAAFTTGQVIAVNGGYGVAAPTYGDQIGCRDW